MRVFSAQGSFSPKSSQDISNTLQMKTQLEITKSLLLCWLFMCYSDQLKTFLSPSFPLLLGV